MNISPRQLLVWRGIVEGAQYKNIADDLGIGTVRSNARKLKLKLGLRMGNRGDASAADLTREAAKFGMI